MTGSEVFARTLAGYGTTHFFFVPTVGLKALRVMEELGIQPISAHGEKAAAYMADGFARASGRPGFCGAQAVGASNMAAGLKDAHMAGSPVIAFVGGPAPATAGKAVYQEIRDIGLFTDVTKWVGRVQEVGQLPQMLREAYRRATSGAPGPICLEGRGHWAHVLDDRATIEPEVDPRFASVPAFRSAPDRASIEAAASELARADRPVIVAGTGVIQSGAQEALTALAEHLSIPVATSAGAKAALADDHPLNVGVVGTYARRCANDVVAASDCVFYVASKTGSMVTNNWRTPARATTTVLHLDIDPVQLGCAYPTDIAMLGDAREGLELLLAATAKAAKSAWSESARASVRAWNEQMRALETSNDVPVRPERIMAELSRVLPDDGVVVVDTLQSSLWAGSFLRLRSSRQQYIRCAGSLGWGLPGAIGAKCALGGRPTVCFTGDGAMYYHLAELETAARYKIGIVVVINNNGSYAGEKPLWDATYEGAENQPDHMWRFGSRDFSAIARELGCEGVRVEEPFEVGTAIAKALASGRPTVVDVVSDPTAVADKGWG